MFSVSLHSTVLCLTTQHYSLSYYAALFSVSLHSTILCLTTQHYSFVSLHSTILCLITQHYSLTYYAALFFVSLHGTILWLTTQHYSLCLQHYSLSHYTALSFVSLVDLSFQHEEILSRLPHVEFWTGYWMISYVWSIRHSLSGESLSAASTTTLRCSCLEQGLSLPYRLGDQQQLLFLT